jgi:hypothetical protein
MSVFLNDVLLVSSIVSRVNNTKVYNAGRKSPELFNLEGEFYKSYSLVRLEIMDLM